MSGRGFLPCRTWGSAKSHRCMLPLSAGRADAAAGSAAEFKWLTERPRLEMMLCTHKNPCVLRLGSSKGFGRSARGDVWMHMGGRGRAAVRPAFCFALRHSSGLQERGYFLFGLKKQSYLCPFMQDKGLWKVPGVPKVENHRPLPLPCHLSIIAVEERCFMICHRTLRTLLSSAVSIPTTKSQHVVSQRPHPQERVCSGSPSSSALAQLSLNLAEKQDQELGCLWSDPSNHPRRGG